jgi:transposase InsO family protein
MQYPGQRVQIDVKVVPQYCIQDKKWKRYYQYTAIDEFSRLRYLEAYQQANTYSSANFVKKLVRYFKSHKIKIETIQTDNGTEFTSYYRRGEDCHLSLFEQTLEALDIRHKRIKPYTPRHNGKVERSHREDQKRFYDKAKFFSFDDFRRQLKRHFYRSNRIPMKPLTFLSPILFLKQSVQYV